jgi:PKHD-type hydroxylase
MLRVLPPRRGAAPSSLPAIAAQGLLSPAQCELLLSAAAALPEQPAIQAYDPGGLTPLTLRRGRATLLPPLPAVMPIYEALVEAARTTNAGAWRFTLDAMEWLQVSAWSPGDAFAPHTDFGFRHPRRVLTLSVQLDPPDAYEGGAMELLEGRFDDDGGGLAGRWDRAVAVAPTEQGAGLFFAACVPHQVRPVLSGCRRSLVAWFQGTAD